VSGACPKSHVSHAAGALGTASACFILRRGCSEGSGKDTGSEGRQRRRLLVVCQVPLNDGTKSKPPCHVLQACARRVCRLRRPAVRRPATCHVAARACARWGVRGKRVGRCRGGRWGWGQGKVGWGPCLGNIPLCRPAHGRTVACKPHRARSMAHAHGRLSPGVQHIQKIREERAGACALSACPVAGEGQRRRQVVAPARSREVLAASFAHVRCPMRHE